MRHPHPLARRAALTLAALATAAAAIGGASLALFRSSAAAQQATSGAGTVVLGTTAPPFHCALGNLEPGDSGSCSYAVRYTGSLNAWVSVDVYATTTGTATYTPAGSATALGGEVLLNDGADTHGLTATLSDTLGSPGPSVPPVACPYADTAAAEGGGPLGSATACSGWRDDEFLRGNVASPAAQAGSWSPGTRATVTVHWELPLGPFVREDASSSTSPSGTAKATIPYKVSSGPSGATVTVEGHGQGSVSIGQTASGNLVVSASPTLQSTQLLFCDPKPIDDLSWWMQVTGSWNQLPYQIVHTLSAGLINMDCLAVDVTGGLSGATLAVSSHPAVTGLTPSQGSTAGGDLVTIVGSGLSGATGVAFGGVPGTSLTVLSPDAIQVRTPPAVRGGPADVVVTSIVGSSAPGGSSTFVAGGS